MDSNMEHAHTINGVPGRMHNRRAWDAARWSTQTWTSERRLLADGTYCQVNLSFDDNSRNGHNTFGMTGEIFEKCSNGRYRDIGGGQCIEAITEAFPTIAPLHLWHLCSTEGPMHYLGNTIFHAGDRDCHGLRKGERRQIRNGRTGLPSWELVTVGPDGQQVEQPEQYPDSAEQPPCDVRLQYRPWCRIGEGKERQFDYARSSACWPEATDAELSTDPETLKAALLERLPALLVRFKDAVTSAGFAWAPEQEG